MTRPYFDDGDPRVEMEVQQVVVVSFVRGRGTEDSIMRRVIRYYDMEGEVLFENDPLRRES